MAAVVVVMVVGSVLDLDLVRVCGRLGPIEALQVVAPQPDLLLLALRRQRGRRAPYGAEVHDGLKEGRWKRGENHQTDASEEQEEASPPSLYWINKVTALLLFILNKCRKY